MGSSADDRLTTHYIAALTRKPAEWIDADAIHDAADEERRLEKMKFPDAVRLVTGQTRKPYGSFG